MKRSIRMINKNCRNQYLWKPLTLTLFFFVLVTQSYAQNHTAKNKPKGETLLQVLEKRNYAGPKTKYPVASREFLRKAKDVTDQPLNFPDLVWFPGEWEEVKAILVSPHYLYNHVESVNDKAWYTIGGFRLRSRPSAKGFYLYNGKKVVIR